MSSEICQNSDSILKDTNESFVSADVVIDWNPSLLSKLNALNREFATMGLGSFIAFQNTEINKSTIQLKDFTDCCYGLFELYLQGLSVRSETDDRLRRLTADLEHSRKMHQRCQNELDTAKSSIAQGRDRERRFEIEKAALNAQIKCAKESARRMNSDIQHRTTRFQHELKKRELESTDLKKRLHALFQSGAPLKSTSSASSAAASKRQQQSTTRKISIVPSCSSISINSVDSSEDRNHKVQQHLAQHMIAQLESREHELFYENRELRDLVSVLASRMFRFADFLREPKDDDETSLDGRDDDEEKECQGGDKCVAGCCSSSSDDEDASNSLRRKSANVHTLLLEMPFPLVRDRLTSRVHRLSRLLWRRLKERCNEDATGCNISALPFSNKEQSTAENVHILGELDLHHRAALYQLVRRPRSLDDRPTSTTSQDLTLTSWGGEEDASDENRSDEQVKHSKVSASPQPSPITVIDPVIVKANFTPTPLRIHVRRLKNQHQKG